MAGILAAGRLWTIVLAMGRANVGIKVGSCTGRSKGAAAERVAAARKGLMTCEARMLTEILGFKRCEVGIIMI